MLNPEQFYRPTPRIVQRMIDRMGDRGEVDYSNHFQNQIDTYRAKRDMARQNPVLESIHGKEVERLAEQIRGSLNRTPSDTPDVVKWTSH